MEMKRARRAIRETARRQGITEEQVVSEIQSSIDAAISKAQEENNEYLLAQWKKIPHAGERPNAYELVAYIGGKVRF